jgi:heterodisulfide reductase subunit A-like polyferredoxin
MIYEKEKRYIIPFDDVPSERQIIPALPVEERKGNFVEVETGFTEEQARMEAKRCLSCRRCLGCALCWAECKPEAIDFDIPDQFYTLEFDEVILTPGLDSTFYPVDSRLGYNVFANVLTDGQFERMLSPNGPTGGMIQSPLNGEIPARLAIIQSRPGAGEKHLASSFVLGVNEAILAQQQVPDISVTLISPVTPSLKEKYEGELKKLAWLKVIDGQPLAVEKEEDGERLLIRYEEKSGPQVEGGYDLVVVLTEPQLSPELKTLSKKLEQEVL